MQRGRPDTLDRDALSDARCLVAETKLLDQRSVRLEIAPLEVRQQPAAGADHLQESPATVMVLGVGPKVIGEGIDPLGEEGDLHLGRPGVLLMGLVLGHGALLVEAHAAVP
jgi:hypothetical protein